MKKSELRQMIQEVLREELSRRKLQESVASKIYVVFNYYPVKRSNNDYDLDDFYLHAATADRSEALNSLKEEALYRVENVADLDNTLVCYEIDPAEYDCSPEEFFEAEGYGGQNLHWEYRDITYALSSIANYETPLYELPIGNVVGLYEDFIVDFGDELGLSVDDLYVYRSTLNTDTVEAIQSDKRFNSYVERKLAITI